VLFTCIVCPSVCLSVCLSVCPAICPSDRPSIHPSVRPACPVACLLAPPHWLAGWLPVRLSIRLALLLACLPSGVPLATCCLCRPSWWSRWRDLGMSAYRTWETVTQLLAYKMVLELGSTANPAEFWSEGVLSNASWRVTMPCPASLCCPMLRPMPCNPQAKHPPSSTSCREWFRTPKATS
jgi:hypothetical protein